MDDLLNTRIHKVVRHGPVGFGLLICVVAALLYLNIPEEPTYWKDYSDSWDYLHQSEMSFFSSEFFFPSADDSIKFDARPFTVPLIFKLCGQNIDAIIVVQKLLLAVSTLLLALSLFLYVPKSWVKYFLVGSLFTLVSWWNILGWTRLLLSESISISLLFIWLSSFLWYFKKPSYIKLSLHFVMVVLFSFTRDNWPYFLLLFYGMILLIAVIWHRKVLVHSLLSIVLVTAVFFIQQRSAQVGHRHQLPVIHNIVMRVLPNEAYTQWFAARGMPCIDSLKANFSDCTNENKKIYKLYRNPDYSEFLEWVKKEGRGTYTRFLISHPSCLFLLNGTTKIRKEIFAHDLLFAGPSMGPGVWVKGVFPLFGSWFVVGLGLLCSLLFLKSKDLRFLLPPVLIILTTGNVFILYNADAMEVDRHLFITRILMELIGFISISLVLGSQYPKRLFQLFLGNRLKG